jgi:hypothetical protein
MFAAAAVSPAAPDTFMHSPLLFCYERIWSVVRGALGEGLRETTLHLPPPFPMRDWSIALDDLRIETWVSFNLGELLLGLGDAASLVPALLGILVMATWASRLASRDGRGSPMDRISIDRGDQ